MSARLFRPCSPVLSQARTTQRFASSKTGGRFTNFIGTLLTGKFYISRRLVNASVNNVFLRYFYAVKPTPVRNFFINSVLLAAAGFGAYYATDSRSGLHRYILVPLMRWQLDAEAAHRAAIDLLASGIAPVDRSPDAEDPALAVEVFGKKLSSPVGLAAGFDKNGEAIDPLFDLGFSYVEIGSITPLPQEGNPKPRFFRLPEDGAAINRYGFNSDGQLKVAVRLRKRLHSFLTHHNAVPENLSLRPNRLLAINLGKNKTGDEVQDYVSGVDLLGNYADVLVINISSPNTPGLRDMQGEAKLGGLLAAVVKARDALSTPKRPPVCVKIAPDLTEREISSIASVVRDSAIDGVIVSNTTISRPESLKSSNSLSSEIGGLSGPPVKDLALAVVRSLRRNLGPDMTIIGCGGITTGKDAVEFAKAGATFVQALTSFAYDGPGFPSRLRDEIKQELNGKTWAEIVNADFKS
ncbi:Dihydroorotate dehydrogenase-domain-containing protein [Lipomyces arxii]|uniref:Dihydroorotate dehydrogenase-domain-containing protein n=1 Tax=Lipomyces arxii TaxID=56418 RepID=UPI0034CF2AFD